MQQKIVPSSLRQPQVAKQNSLSGKQAKPAILLMDKILHHLTTLPWKGRIATPAWPQCWRDPSEEVVQDFVPSTCFNVLTVVAPMSARENEGSKKTVRNVVQDFAHQQFGFITLLYPACCVTVAFCAYLLADATCLLLRLFLLSFVGVYYTLLSREKGCCGGSTQCSDSAQNSARMSKTLNIPAIWAVAVQSV